MIIHRDQLPPVTDLYLEYGFKIRADPEADKGFDWVRRNNFVSGRA